MKRQLSPAFSERSLQFQEPIIQGYTDTLIRKLTEASKDGKPVNLREWFNHYTFDIIGNLGFGSDFGGLESEQYHPWVKAVSQNVREFAIMQVLMYLGLQRIVHVLSGSSLLRGKILHEHLTREKVEARIKVEKPRLDIFQPLLDRKPPLVCLSPFLSFYNRRTNENAIKDICSAYGECYDIDHSRLRELCYFAGSRSLSAD
jgi:hypothetical protein